MRSLEAHRLEVSSDPTRMLTKFELPRPAVTPPESGRMAIDRTAIMPAFESVKLLAVAIRTPFEEMKPVALPSLPTPTPAPALESMLVPMLELMPEPTSRLTPLRPRASGAWQALVLSVALSAAFLLCAQLVGVLLF